MKLYLVILLVLLTQSLAFAQIYIDAVNVKCTGSNECENRLEKLGLLSREYPSFDHVKTLLKLYIRDESVKYFKYNLEKISENHFKLNGHMELIKRIEDLSFDELERYISIPNVNVLREQSFFEASKLEKLNSDLESLFAINGYPKAEVYAEVNEKNDGYYITLHVKPGPKDILKEIKIVSSNKLLLEILHRKLNQFLDKPFNSTEFKNEIAETEKLFVDYGYYSIDLKFKKSSVGEYKSQVVIQVKNDDLYSFHFTKNEFFGDKVLKDKMRDSMKLLKRIHDRESVKAYVKDLYLSKGFRDVVVSVHSKTKVNNDSVKNNFFNVTVDEGRRYKLNDISFKGNDFFSDSELKKLFYEMGDNDILYGYHNEKYYFDFANLLKTKYLENGFVNILIEKPQFNFDDEKKHINIDYRIREVVRSSISSLEIIGPPQEIQEEIKSVMINKKGNYFNPLIFEGDLKAILRFLRNEGYYYATIKSIDSKELVTYNQDNTNVKIRIHVNLDKKYTINDLIIIGNYKTRYKLIRRESGFIKGEYLTEKDMRRAQTYLLALGLFSRVQIKPIKMGSKVDLFIDVEEKDFGLIELAPGYRTDIGIKLSGRVSYINLEGMNKQLSVSALVNSRTDLSTLDERRQQENHRILEYEVNLNYLENKIFEWPIDYAASFSTLRRRFFAFDADIDRLYNTVSHNVNDWFSYSIKHQLENIKQHDATLEREHGEFRVGSLTPGLTFDFRDNRINPLKGAYFNLTCEFASPAFGSQTNDELSVNYYKLISRNRFYVPMGDVTLAVSTSLGIQKNLAENTIDDSDDSNGYIPNIKVFRLTGVDLVRGFEDSEINRLVTGEDISEARVDDSAYMVNLKLEPRVFISDSMMFGVFYDAGRVFVDSYDFNELRSSAGLTFKYLTPVGSLDFDYGIKLLRKRDSSGRLESPGRLHVSIGFF